MSFVGKILPVEGYKVIFSGTLHVDYTKSLTHLYQPLIGINAIALYYTLVHEIELQNLTDKQTHHTLMGALRSEEHTSELQSRGPLVCRLLLEQNNEER